MAPGNGKKFRIKIIFENLNRKMEKKPKNDLTSGFTAKFVSHLSAMDRKCLLDKPDGSGLAPEDCGEYLEMHLRVTDNKITRCVYQSDACAHTVASASAAAMLAEGKALPEVLKIQTADIVRELDGLPAEHVHCAELAVGTLHAAALDCLKNQNSPWKKMYKRAT